MRYSVKAAAIATGVSESRLRTWERRYGIPRPARSPTGRRLYDEDDLAVIRRMAALVAAGFPASAAAEAALIEEEPMAVEDAQAQENPLVGDLVQASLAFDELAVTQIVREATKPDWDKALEAVFFPALKRIGDYWSEGTTSCVTEHFTTEVIRREFSASLAGLPDPKPGAPSVLLACPEDERHEIGLLALSLLLRQRGLRVLYLGADVPATEMLFAAQRTEPAAICLSATTGSGLASLGRTARTVVSSHLSTRLFVGGPAFGRNSGDETIPGIRLPHSIRAAADVMADSLRTRSEG